MTQQGWQTHMHAVQPQTQAQTQTSSQYGERLEYEGKKEYRDLWAMIVFWIQVLACIGVAIYFWIKMGDNVEVKDVDHSKAAPYYTIVVVSAISGIIFGFVWLKVMMCCAGTIIKIMLFVNIAMWIIYAILGLVESNIAVVVIGVIFALLSALYTYCVWGRIPFASALLTISSKIVAKYNGTICVSLTVILCSVVWIFIWISMVLGYFLATKSEDINSFLVFIFLVSFYWGMQVWKNVSHTTTCGVSAAWYFSIDKLEKPTQAAFKRTMTTSFGSVCFGSLIVAVIQAIKAMVRSASNQRSIVGCVAVCLLACIERLVRYFNSYAYAQCAIYGTGFIESAKATWNLFESKGIMALINDDLTGGALICGSVLAYVISGLIAFGILRLWGDLHNELELDIGIACLVGLLGFVLCFQILYVVRSSIICLFVCFAEDPVVLKTNHRDEYNLITGVKPEMGAIAEGQPHTIQA